MSTRYRYTAYDQQGKRWEVRLDVVTWSRSSYESGFDHEVMTLICECRWKKHYFWANGKRAAMDHLANRHGATHQRQTTTAGVGCLALLGFAIAVVLGLLILRR